MNDANKEFASPLPIPAPVLSILPRALVDRPRQIAPTRPARSPLLSKRPLTSFSDYQFGATGFVGSPPSVVALTPALRKSSLLSENILDLMEREQDAIVLKLMREIDLLKAENNALRSGQTPPAPLRNNSIGCRSNLVSGIAHKRHPLIFEETKKKARIDPALEAVVEENKRLRARIQELEHARLL